MRSYVKPQMLEARRHPETGLYCREDGAVLLPPSGRRVPRPRWSFGAKRRDGYLKVAHRGKCYAVHRLICGAFHDLAPADKPFVDHINRIRTDNRPSNLHWASVKENNDNRSSVNQSIEKYGVRSCEDRKAYDKAYKAAHRATPALKESNHASANW